LVLAKAQRVVVGFRDPNPRVDGGGVKVLQEAGVQVDMAPTDNLERWCADLVTNFCNRITPKDYDTDYTYITGSMRSALRSLAAREKNQDLLCQVSWGGASIAVTEDLEKAIAELELQPEWMEHLDGLLWREELVLLRLNKAVAKRKGVKLLGQRIAQELQAHVAQSVGHTILLYRPGATPELDLEALVAPPSESE
jgi:RNA-binding protein YhbY